MLRITLTKAAHLITLKLDGRLSGPWVDELRKAWDAARDRYSERPIEIDLTEVTFVGPDGLELLRTMSDEGTELRSTSLMTKFMIGRIQHDDTKPTTVLGG